MLFYRMTKERYADDLTGKGAELRGGRWNRKGLPAIYLAENRSLCLLETIVHCQKITDLYNRLIVAIEVPDKKIKQFDKNLLPENWDTKPWTKDTEMIGSKWLEANSELALQLPSSIIKQESIFMINPRHKEFYKVKISSKEIFKPDNRLAIFK